MGTVNSKKRNKNKSKGTKSDSSSPSPDQNNSTPAKQKNKENHGKSNHHVGKSQMSKSNPDETSKKPPNKGIAETEPSDNPESSTSDRENGKTPTDTTEEEDGVANEIVKASKKVSAEDFELLCVIGRGSFGKVMQVRKKDDGKIYAMKVMKKAAIIAKNQVTHTKDEKNILQKISHPFIVKLNYAFQTKDKLYMILDYVNGGELFFHLKKEGKFSEDRVRLYAAEIASALLHLHSHGIIYRDLKPENILIDSDGHIVITDFGLSKEVPRDETTHTFCGTPEYLAPEVLRGEGHNYQVDWWSLGTLIYEMLTGLPPFYNKNINVMYQRILKGQLSFPPGMSPEAQDLLKGLLTRDVNKRLGGEAVTKHPFFKGIDWDALLRKEIQPPWKPPVKSETDTSQIEDTFKQEAAVDSVVDHSSVLGALTDEDLNDFEGFTFADEKLLEGHKKN
jgi:serine/threonine protein kinase